MKKLSSVVNRETADKALENFLSELSRNGFTEKIKKHISLVWQDPAFFSKAIKKLKGLSFIVGETTFIKLTYPETMYRYEVEINDTIVKLIVQPLHEIGVPYDKGHYGVIPSRLFSLANKVEETPEEVDQNDLPEMTKEEQEIANDYIEELKKENENKPKKQGKKTK